MEVESNYQMPKVNFKNLLQNFKYHLHTLLLLLILLAQKEKFSIGSFGSQGCSREGAFTVQNSDFLLVIGSKLNSLITGPDFEKFWKPSP